MGTHPAESLPQDTDVDLPLEEEAAFDVGPVSSISELLVSVDREKLIDIIRAMRDAVVVFNAEGRIQLCNPVFERVVDRSDCSGQLMADVLRPFGEDFEQAVDKLIRSREAVSGEVAMRRNGRKKVFMLYATPMESEMAEADSPYPAGVAVFHDITQVKQTEKMRRDFVANVSHELRTPLSAIHGYAETLLDGALDDQAVSREFIEIIFNHSKRLSQLVRDLLDLSKLEASDHPFAMEPLGLSSLLGKLARMYEKPMAEKQIHFTSTLDPKLPPVLGSASALEQVITNFLDNALKYTPEGGAITLEAHGTPDGLQVNVSDTGMGIEAKHIPRLFERFYRVDKARSRDLGGTGLGLSIVKHIIQLHDGQLWVDSTPGQGSTFSFSLKHVRN